MTIDLEAVRGDTPGCVHTTHLNNAGCSFSPTPVVDSVIDYLRREATLGGYRLETAEQSAVLCYRGAGARLLDCSDTEVAFAPSATAAWWSALRAVVLAPGDRVLATTAEYSSNVFGLIQLQRQGVTVELIPSDLNGQVSVEALSEMMDERVKLVCVTHVPTEGGLVNPVIEIGRVLSNWPALYLLDACQSVGQLPVSVREIGCDFLAATGRKYLRAPRGTGLLYVRSGLTGLADPSLLDLRSASWVDAWRYELPETAWRFETFESSAANRVGLGVALTYACDLGMSAIADRIRSLSAELRVLLQETEGVQLRELDGPQSGLVTFAVDRHEPAHIRDALSSVDITVSVVAPTHEPFDPSRRGGDGMVRASVHYFNTSAELHRLVEQVSQIVSG